MRGVVRYAWRKSRRVLQVCSSLKACNSSLKHQALLRSCTALHFTDYPPFLYHIVEASSMWSLKKYEKSEICPFSLIWVEEILDEVSKLNLYTIHINYLCTNPNMFRFTSVTEKFAHLCFGALWRYTQLSIMLLDC